jgi:hypothetical protein
LKQLAELGYTSATRGIRCFYFIKFLDEHIFVFEINWKHFNQVKSFLNRFFGDRKLFLGFWRRTYAFYHLSDKLSVLSNKPTGIFLVKYLVIEPLNPQSFDLVR